MRQRVGPRPYTEWKSQFRRLDLCSLRGTIFSLLYTYFRRHTPFLLLIGHIPHRSKLPSDLSPIYSIPVLIYYSLFAFLRRVGGYLLVPACCVSIRACSCVSLVFSTQTSSSLLSTIHIDTVHPESAFLHLAGAFTVYLHTLSYLSYFPYRSVCHFRHIYSFLPDLKNSSISLTANMLILLSFEGMAFQPKAGAHPAEFARVFRHEGVAAESCYECGQIARYTRLSTLLPIPGSPNNSKIACMTARSVAG